jgi:hypothetical protein
MATNGGEDGLVSQFTIADDGNHDEDWRKGEKAIY